MASGIERALEVLHRVEARGLAEVKIAAVLSDGEANVPLQPGGDPQEDVLRMLPRLRRLADETVFIDTKRPDRSGRTEMQRFARAAGGRWYGPGHLTASSLLSAVERAERAGGER
jgi:magnesium chelatase subunit D